MRGLAFTGGRDSEGLAYVMQAILGSQIIEALPSRSR